MLKSTVSSLGGLPRAALGLAITVALVLPSSSTAGPKGGISASESDAPMPAGGTAALVSGRATAPQAAPPAVRAAIEAANRIRNRPYLWGGGHGRWWSRGYDCSGAVSFALHGGDLLDVSLNSRSLMRWGEPGEGRWITVYSNPRHVYAVIAGLRWDTAGNRRGISGPRWHLWQGDPRGFVARHPVGY